MGPVGDAGNIANLMVDLGTLHFSYLVKVKKTKINFLDFEVDRLTRSIENVETGDSFPTDVSHLLKADLKQVSKRNGWLFNWKSEIDAPEREVYKLTIQGNLNVIQG